MGEGVLVILGIALEVADGGEEKGECSFCCAATNPGRLCTCRGLSPLHPFTELAHIEIPFFQNNFKTTRQLLLKIKTLIFFFTEAALSRESKSFMADFAAG